MEYRLIKIIENVRDNVYSEIVAETPEEEFDRAEFDKGVSALFECFDDRAVQMSTEEWEMLNIYFVMEMLGNVFCQYCDELGHEAACRYLVRVYQKFDSSFLRGSRIFQIASLELAVCSIYIGDIDFLYRVYRELDIQVIEDHVYEYPFFYADKMALLMDEMRDEKSGLMGKLSLVIYPEIDEATTVDYVCCLSNMCDTYITLKMYEEYKKYVSQLRYWLERLDDDETKKTVWVKIYLYESIMLTEQEKYAMAEQNALQGYGMCEDSEELIEIRLAFINNLLICFCGQGLSEKCIQYLNEGLEIINKYGAQDSIGAAAIYNTWNILAEDEASPESAEQVMSWLWQVDVEKIPIVMITLLLNSIKLNITNNKIQKNNSAYVERILNIIGKRLAPDDIAGGILFYWQVQVMFYAYLGDIQRSKSAFDSMYWLSDRCVPDMDIVIEFVCREYDTVKAIMDRNSLGSLLFALARRTPLRLADACDMGDDRGLIDRVSRISILFKIIVAAIYRNDISCSDNDFFELVCNMKNVYPDVLRKRKLKYVDVPEMERLNELHRELLDLDGIRYYGREVDQEAIDALEYEIHELEKKIYSQEKCTYDGEFAWEKAGDLVSRLPDKTVYIDYVQFTDGLKDVTEKDLRYGVVVAFRQGQQVYVQRLDAINAYNVRMMFSSLEIKTRRKREYGETPGILDKWVNKTAESMLYSQLILPVWQVTGPGCDIRRIIISGDIELPAFAFDMLLDPSGRYLAERYDVNFVNSIRNKNNDLWLNGLLDNSSSLGNREKCMVVGNPQFTVDKSLVSEGDKTFVALPLSKVEAQAAADVLETDVIQKKKANKNIFREIHVPVLHIATHGEHLTDEKFLEKNERLLYDMPLRKTCFFMSGANDWIATGKSDPVYGTGLVSAEEICTYDWSGVRLVILSACFSGSGDISYEEGLLGMNTAFIAQGVQAAIISLWEVDDLAAAVLMTRFYENLKRMSVSESLWRAKRYLMTVTVGELTDDGWFGEQKVRRMGLVADNMRKLAHYPADTRLFANPVYWAGFTLWL